MNKKFIALGALALAVATIAVWQLTKRHEVQPSPPPVAQAPAPRPPTESPKESSGEKASPAVAALWTAARNFAGSRPGPLASTGTQTRGVAGPTASFEVAVTTSLADLKKGSQVSIPLPDGATATGVVNLVQTDATGAVRVGGVLTGARTGSFSLGGNGALVSGRILLPQEKQAYVINTPAAGRTVIQSLPLAEVLCFPFPREPQPAVPTQSGNSGPESAPPILSSRPSATAVLYLDFDGATVTDPDWPAYASDGVTVTGSTIVAPASSLTNAQITEVWNRVKEDYWPFNIDITTDPNRYANAPLGQRMRVIITPNDAAAPGAGGVAYVGSFTGTGAAYQYFQSDNPAWVFNTTVDGIAEAISHELGHTLGLHHDGRNPPSASSSADGSYYYGHGDSNSAVGWAPIMGAGYYEKLVQWSKGEYPGANNQEDDVAIISGGISFNVAPGFPLTNTVGYIADDAGNTRATATAVDVSSGSANFTGIISSASDSDFYAFTVSSPTAMTFAATPPNAYPKQADLDIQLELQDSNGTVLATSNPDATLDASITVGTTPGTYYLKVSGAGRAGNGVTDFGYSNYGSIGQYSVAVTSAAPTPPVITGQDSSLAGPGDYATLNVYATGSPVLGYQWQHLPSGSGSWINVNDDVIFSGAHTSRLQVLVLAGMNGDQFRCLVSNVAGQATSNPVPFSVNPNAKALAWVSVNFPSSAATGSLVTVTATVVNAGAAAWGSGERLALLGPGSNEISSASLSGVAPGQSTTVTLTFTAPYQVLTTAYFLQPLDTAGQFLSTIRSFAFGTFGAAVPPSIVTQPVGYAANVGDNITFSVLAIGQVPFSYQWRLNGTDIPGATNATLVLNNVQVGSAGTYTVRVSNTLGFVISNPAVLTVGIPSAVTAVMAAGDYTLFLRSNGSRWGLGYGFGGQLGDGTTNGRSQPAQIDSGVALLAGGPDQSAFVKLDGTLWTMGLFAGRISGNSTDQQLSPVAVTNGTNVAAVEMGFGSTYFIRTDGTLWTAGANSSGQLGDGTTVYRNTPVQIATDVAAVAGGNLHALFLKPDGTVWAMGSSNSGAIGAGVYHDVVSQANPVPVLVAQNAKEIAAGVNYSAVLKSDGTLWVTGSALPMVSSSDFVQLAANVRTMAAGDRHLLFIKTDNTLWAVGKNDAGQLGDGTNTDRATPVQISGSPVKIAAGGRHSLFIDANGSLWGMGSSQYYQIGNQVGVGTNTPVLIASGNLLAPSAPGSISASDGGVVGAVRISWAPVAGAWGYEIVRNTTNDSSSAVSVGSVHDFTFFYDTSGTPGATYYYWVRATYPAGVSAYSPVDAGYSIAPTPPAFTSQPANYSYTLGATTLPSFTAIASGNPAPAYRWQILATGNPTWTDISTSSNMVTGVLTPTLTFISAPDGSFNGYRYRCVATNQGGGATSNEATLTVTADPPQITFQPRGFVVNPGSGGQLFVGVSSALPVTVQWQRNGTDIVGATDPNLQLTNLEMSGNYSARVTSTAGSVTSADAVVSVVPAVGVIASAASDRGSVFLRADKSLWGMGNLGYGPWPNQLATDISSVAAGTNFIVYVKVDGTLWHSGRYFYPYSPPPGLEVWVNGGTGGYSTIAPVQLASDVLSVSAGDDHIVFIKTDGSLWALGTNTKGQLGDGTFTSRSTPVQIAQNVSMALGAGRSTFFIKQDESLWSIGDNTYGQLGDGTIASRNVPMQIASGASIVRGGSSHTIFLKSDGTMWGMGTNFGGELGVSVPPAIIQNFTFVGGQQTVPVQIEPNVTQVMAGAGTTTFRRGDGTTWTMGANGAGQLGLGNTVNATVPVQVPAADLDHSSVYDHLLIVRADGSLWSAGLNFSGALGDGTTTPHYDLRMITSGPYPAVIVAQPVNRTANLGQSATLTATIGGSPAPSCQWQRLPAGSGTWSDISDGVVYSGSTASTLTVTGVTIAMNGDQFRCVATNVSGSAISNAATLTVTVPLPVITTQPAAQTVAVGASINLSVTASSPVALSYQWRKNGTDIGGATSSSYSIASAQLSDSADYGVVVTNSAGSVASNLTTVVVVAPPVITTQPATQAVTVEQPASFSVTATSGVPLSYVWRKNGTPIGGATASTYTIAATQLSDAGDYSVVVTNVAGSVTSNNATLTVNVAPPVITVHPANQSITQGATANFSITATGTPAPTYQWQVLPVGGGSWTNTANGATYAGSQTATLTVSGAQAVNSGDQYRCVATNAGGSVTSNAASLTVVLNPGPIAVAAGGTFTSYLRFDGSLFGTGTNTDGQLGDGTLTNRTAPVSGATGVAAVAAGTDHQLLLMADGSLWVTGFNPFGALGTNDTTSRSTPVQIATGVAAIAAGHRHSLFIKTDGTLWAMGWNSTGQLGDGSTTNRLAPVQVATHVIAAAGGVSHSLFLKSDGTAWAMGDNSLGQLGDGTTTNRSTPVQIATGVASISAGGYFNLLLKTDGTLWTVGFNGFGELGDGTTTNRPTPVQVASGVRAMSGGFHHGMYLKADGTLWSTGYNDFGQIGDGTVTSRSVPFQLATGVTGLSAGRYQGAFIKSDGSLWVVGGNNFSQLGDNTTTNRLTPVQLTTGTVSLPALVTSLSASESVGSDRVTLSWPAALGATYYEVWRSTTAQSSDAVRVATQLPGTFFEDVTASTGVVYQYWVRPANGAGVTGFGTSDAGSFGPIIVAPTITVPPASQTVNVGTNVTFSVTATGTAPFTYQWRKNTSTIPGATASSYTITGVAVADAGSYDVVVTNSANSAISSAATLVVNKLNQAITFGTLADRVYTPVPFTLVATADSSLPVSFSIVSGPANLSGSDVTITGVGTVTVRAAQAGNGTYSAAANIDRSFVVSKATATVTLAGLTATYDGTAKSVTATTNPAALAVDVTYDASPTAPTNAGSYAVVGTVNDANYQGSASGTLVISKAAAVVTLGNLTATYDGTAKSATATTNPAALSIGLTYNGSGTAPTNAGSYAVVGTINETNYAGAASGTLVIAKAAQTIAFPNPADQPFSSAPITLSATASSGLPVTFAILSGPALAYGFSGTQITLTGVGPVMLRASQAGDGNHNAAPDVDRSFAALAGSVYDAPYIFVTLAGSAGLNGSVNGQGNAARFAGPTSVAVDGAGYLYVADASDHTIRKISPSGAVTTLAGSAGVQGSSDGTGSGALFYNPQGVAVDSSGTVYVADSGNNTIRKITPAGVVTTLAGFASPVHGLVDAVGGAARFYFPTGLAVDGSGNIYVADTLNNAIRKVTPSGAVTTIASGGAAQLSTPYGVTVDGGGNVYVADTYNSTIRKISPGGTVSTLAGTAGLLGSMDGTGSAARFNYPYALTVDGSGNVYVADTLSDTIRRITPAGVVTTIAGSTDLIGSSDGTGDAARFYYPNGVIVDSAGVLYVADLWNYTVRKGGLPVAPTIGAQPASQTVTAGNPVLISVSAGGFPAPVFQWRKDGIPLVDGGNISGTTAANLTITGAQSGNAGTYDVVVSNAVGNVTSNPATIAILVGYAAWSQSRFTASELADPNISGPNAVYGIDGLPNLVKYALGLEPKQNITSGLPAPSVQGSDWVYTYTRPSDRTDITYAVEFSTNLSTWTTAGVTHELVSSGGGNETWHAKYPLASAANCYFRLKVVQP